MTTCIQPTSQYANDKFWYTNNFHVARWTEWGLFIKKKKKKYRQHAFLIISGYRKRKKNKQYFNKYNIMCTRTRTNKHKICMRKCNSCILHQIFVKNVYWQILMILFGMEKIKRFIIFLHAIYIYVFAFLPDLFSIHEEK